MKRMSGHSKFGVIETEQSWYLLEYLCAHIPELAFLKYSRVTGSCNNYPCVTCIHIIFIQACVAFITFTCRML